VSPTKSDTLRVPGATLYYQVRGSGPLLLILQGGDGDADGSNGVADQLVDHYTVATYDRRGLSRSTIDDPTEPLSLETHGDDVHHLLAALTSEPAFVLGNSLGALLGLDLVARYPEQVRTVVAHEPPAAELLSDAERAQAERSQEDIKETFRREGLAAAIKKMVASSALNFDDREPEVVLPQSDPQRGVNLSFFFAHDVGAVHRYRLNLPALKAVATRIVPAGGCSSREIWPYHAAKALADQLGTDLVEFPGGHNGFVLHPRGFAARLREVLGN